MTHGFDDEGHKFDARGDLHNWWQPRDLQQFDARAQCVVDQFSHMVAVDKIHYQGRLVAGEAIADLGGVIIGYRALQLSNGAGAHEVRDGYTPEQRYFLSFAQSWTESIRAEAARTQALTDPHPLPRDRVNGTVANIPAWYAAFHCGPPPPSICTIW
jgi:predicted metalloendopeptidase